MSNVAPVLKEEIARVARKEVRREIAGLKKSSATYRSEIAALKKRAVALEQQVRQTGKVSHLTVSTGADQDAPSANGNRFSSKGMASQRRRLGLSAAECGLLIGASAQSVYNWEEGKVRPRAQHLPAIYALRTLGRRQAGEILEVRKAA